MSNNRGVSLLKKDLGRLNKNMNPNRSRHPKFKINPEDNKHIRANDLGAALKNNNPSQNAPSSPNVNKSATSPNIPSNGPKQGQSISNSGNGDSNTSQDWASPSNNSANDWRSPEAAMQGSINHDNQASNRSEKGNLNSIKSPNNRPSAKEDRKHNKVLNGAKLALHNPLKNDLGGVFKATDLGIGKGDRKAELQQAKEQAKGIAKDQAKKMAKRGVKRSIPKVLKSMVSPDSPVPWAAGIWALWHIARQTLFKGVMGILNKFPILNKLAPIMKDAMALSKAAVKGLWGAVKGGFGLLGRAAHGIAHGLGSLAQGTAHTAATLAHAAVHPLAAASSVAHAVTSGAVLTHVSLSSAMKLGAVGIASISLVGAGDYMFNTRTSNPIGCAVQQIKQDVTDSISGTDGEWTKKGTKAHNIAKAVYAAAKAQGCDDKHAAAVTGNAAHESAMFAHGLKVHQFGGGPGEGLFQFNPDNAPSNWSPSSQVKKILSEGGHSPGVSGGGLSKGQWERRSGSVSSLTNSFEFSFEAGGKPDNGLRDRLANRAYAMFKGIGGKTSAADDNDEAASAGAKGACSKSSGSDTNASDVVKFAERYLGLKYHLGGNSIPISKGKPKSEVNPTDCNKFAWAVERGSGHAVPPDMPGDCDDSIHRLHKFEVPASKAHAGSLVINHYHAMVMMTPWRGLKGTKLIQEGGGGNDVNEGHSYYWSMASYLGSKRYFFNIPKR